MIYFSDEELHSCLQQSLSTLFDLTKNQNELVKLNASNCLASLCIEILEIQNIEDKLEAEADFIDGGEAEEDDIEDEDDDEEDFK